MGERCELSGELERPFADSRLSAKIRGPFLLVSALFALMLWSVFLSAPTGATSDLCHSVIARSPTKMQAASLISKVPLSFIPNYGQTDSRVKFFSRGDGYQLFLTSNAAVFSFARSSDEGRRESPTTLRLELKNANAGARVESHEQLSGVENYFLGNQKKRWRTNVPKFGRVTYHDIYSGIDLTYYGNQRRLEYDFEVKPGADPNSIRFSSPGADVIQVDASGDLLMKIGSG
jgi:hypothetical protein